MLSNYITYQRELLAIDTIKNSNSLETRTVNILSCHQIQNQSHLYKSLPLRGKRQFLGLQHNLSSKCYIFAIIDSEKHFSSFILHSFTIFHLQLTVRTFIPVGTCLACSEGKICTFAPVALVKMGPFFIHLCT